MTERTGKKVLVLEKDVATLKQQMKLMTEMMAGKDKELLSIREEVSQLRDKLQCQDENQVSVVLDDEGLKDVRRELEKIRTNMMPGLPVKIAKPPFK